MIEAYRIDPSEWERLKSSYVLGDFLTTCCDSAAIPKTSQNGLPFFAHHSDECATAPETVWHKTAKALIISYLRSNGVSATEEQAGAEREWIADVFFETGTRKVAIELQHSYQTLRKYQDRQARYREAGIECYWLLYPERFKTLSLSLAKWRIRNEFGGRFPEVGLSTCLPELPFLALEIEPAPQVKGPGFFSPTLEDWVSSILCRSFIVKNGLWAIESSSTPAI